MPQEDLAQARVWLRYANAVYYLDASVRLTGGRTILGKYEMSQQGNTIILLCATWGRQLVRSLERSYHSWSRSACGCECRFLPGRFRVRAWDMGIMLC